MLLRNLVVVGLVGFSLAFNVATAEDAGTLAHSNGAYAIGAVDGVSFADIGDRSPVIDNRSLEISLAPYSAPRFPNADLAQDPTQALDPTRSGDRDRRNLELAVTENRIGGSPLDVEFTQRASVGFNAQGDIESRSHGREVRLGQRLGRQLGDTLGISEWSGGTASWDNPTWYFFAASDDEALAFRGGRVTLQDRIEVGDLQAGITLERGPMRASIAYIERETSTQIGETTYSYDQRFTGVTLTWRHY